MEIKVSNDMAHKVFDELRQYNDNYEPKVNYKPITFYIEEGGEFIAGLEGFLAWDMFEIGNMVALEKRKGLGTRLINHAEAYAKENGANKMIAWTLDFQAPNFYRKMGFEEVVKMPNYAGKHSQYYFIKRF